MKKEEREKETKSKKSEEKKRLRGSDMQQK